MTHELMEHCKKDIRELLNKKLIRLSKSPWSCAAFYVNKHLEIERGTPRLVINYKPLNTLPQIKYPIPNKEDILKRLTEAKKISKFDLKSRFWQIQIQESDKYKTTFTTPFDTHTQLIKKIKIYAKEIPCLHLASPLAFKILKTDASDIG
ncbi:LOW QUALITY PROTEIN: hypothetical protein CFOL_v3_07844, partial [Cephalotus follicularis]